MSNPRNPLPALPANVVAHLKNVTKRFGQTTALDNVTIELRRGELLALLGPNGAGKTSAVRLLLGLSSPTSGIVSVVGGDPREDAYRSRTGVMLQSSRVPDALRVREHIALFSLESRYEIVKHLRTPSFIIPTLTFPLIFYLFFGVTMGGRGIGAGAPLGVYLIATYGAFAVINAAFASFGVSLALERGRGVLQLKHATPMPLYAYMLAKLASATVLSTMVTMMLFAVGTAFGGARIDAQNLAALSGTLVAGTVPFALLGLTVGYIVPAEAAIAVINVLALQMGFLSGLWMPIEFLPDTVRQIATFLPAFHLGQLALGAIDMPTRGAAGGHITALIGFTLLFLATAIAAYRIDRRTNYA